MMQGYIQRGYKLFTERVAEGRNMETGQVEKLAEGRVWTGQQAVGNGLADANGNLQTAIKKAASLAKIKDYHTEYAPTPAPWYEGLFDPTEKGLSEHGLTRDPRNILRPANEPETDPANERPASPDTV